MDKYIGFDIDDKKIVACVVQNGIQDIYETLVPGVDSMKAFLDKQRKGGCKTHLVFEISGQAGFVYDSLQGHVDSITVANPSKMTWIYRTSKKNDRIDARKMAILLSINEIPAVHMPTKEVRQWRATILHRRNIKRKMLQVENRIRAILKSQAITKSKHGGKWWSKKNRSWFKELCGNDKFDSNQLWRIALADLLVELELLEIQHDRIVRYLDDYLSSKPGAVLLMSIPGIGPRTAEAILAYTDDVTRFKSSKQYCSYFGLVPKLDESGSVRHLGHITKQGPSVVRWLLCECCWKTIKFSPALRKFYDQVKGGQKGRTKVAIVAVSRKILRSHPKTSFALKMALFASGQRQTKATLASAKADLSSLPETKSSHFQPQSRFWDDFEYYSINAFNRRTV